MGLGKGPSWIAWWFYNFMWGRGGVYSDEWTVTLDRPETQAAAQYVRSLVNERRFAVVAAEDNVADFTGGVTACTIASTGSLKGVIDSARFDFGTGFLPKGPAGPACPTGGTGIAIASARSPEQQLAAGTFLKFLTEPEQTAYFSANTGYMPVRTSAATGSTMAAVYAENPRFRTAVDQLATTRVQDWARAFVPSGDQYLTTALERVLLQNEDPAAAFSAAANEITTSYEQNVARYL